MSSIYKKSRDGYFYYQTYLYNPKTNKKDKKIFHSLGTKSKKEAEEKKKELDKSYLNKKSSNARLEFKLSITKIFWSSILLILSGSLISIIIYNNLYMEKFIAGDEVKNINVIEPITKKNDQKINEENPENLINKDSQSGEKEQEIITAESETKDFKNVGESSGYSIHRVKKITSNFNQIEVYVVLDEFFNQNYLEELCYEIKSEYSNFNNILISIYKNNEFGIALANGKGENINNMEIKNSWLAMFTFNIVEGAYFDNNPASYLGNY